MFHKNPSAKGLLGWGILYSIISLIVVGISYVKDANMTLVPFALLFTLTIMIAGYNLEVEKDE